ncbi:alpha/beta hydrolase [Nonomuraea polychroma]|uniref:alpha/beta hydrolase n=1 Tax=Nonomuraea polychroma TaxID=46176 RepID=UPI003D94EEC6
MPLDPDAQALAEALDALLPGPLHSLGVDGARALAEQLGEQSPPPPPLHLVEQRTIPGPAGEIPIRVYRPSPETDLPVLLYFHGGGWTIGTLDGVETLCRTLSEKAHCVVVSVDYRLAPEHKFPAAVEDCYAALEWVAAHAGEIGADAGRIAVGGDSAGGNLSASISILARDRNGPQIALQLLVYPATEYAVERASWREHATASLLTAEDVLWFWGHYLRDEADRSDPRATPSNAPSLAGLPPAFVLTAEYDPIRDDGEQYAQRLREAGVPVIAKRYPRVFHGFFTMVGLLGKTKEALEDAAARLNDAFARPRAEG